MVNEKNLKPVKTKEEARTRGRNGGIASGKAKREKKTIQKIVTALCESKCTDIQQFKKIAEKLGLEKEKTVKELFTLLGLLNTLKTVRIDDLTKLAELLGEQSEAMTAEEEKQVTMLEAIEKAVKNAD